jgi:hypothetical protein
MVIEISSKEPPSTEAMSRLAEQKQRMMDETL